MSKLSLALAQALYLSAKDKDRAAAKQVIARFIDSVRRRFGAAELSKVLEAMPKAADLAEGIEDVSVETARDLPRSAVNELLESLGIDLGKASVKVKVAPELIAGARVRRRGSVTDMSARGVLNRLTTVNQ